MSSNTIPTIAHATVTANAYGRYNIVMDDGWVFWDRSDYGTDENGNFVEPLPEEICYSRAGYNYPADYDFDNRIVVVAEADVPANQIFGDVTPPAVTE